MEMSKAILIPVEGQMCSVPQTLARSESQDLSQAQTKALLRIPAARVTEEQCLCFL